MNSLFSRRKDDESSHPETVGVAELELRVKAHVALMNCQIDKFPLILAVVGEPGIGKTFTIKNVLEQNGVFVSDVSSAALAHHKEGMVLYPLIRQYRDCGIRMEECNACLLIDDFDRSIASGYGGSGHTIHSKLLEGFLMDLCDNPYSVPDEENRVSTSVRKVPIILTGNNFSSLDPALTRAQRMTILHFKPDPEDLIKMIIKTFGLRSDKSKVLSPHQAESLVKRFPKENIAFFSDLVSEYLVESTKSLFENLGKHNKEYLTSVFRKSLDSLDFRQVIETAEKVIARRNSVR